MGNSQLPGILRNFGLSERESMIYSFLLEKGPQKAATISKALRLYRQEVYRAIDEMQKQNTVEITFESPKRFAAVPIERIYNSYTTQLVNRLKFLEDNKEEMLNQSKIRSIKNDPVLLERMRIVEGEKIDEVVDEIKSSSKSDVSIMAPLEVFLSIDREGRHEIFEKSKSKFRYLTQVGRELSKFEKQVLTRCSRLKNVEVRHTNTNFTAGFFPTFVIGDAKEFSLVTGEYTQGKTQYSALCTNNKILTSLLQQYFENEWEKATSILSLFRMHANHIHTN